VGTKEFVQQIKGQGEQQVDNEIGEKVDHGCLLGLEGWFCYVPKVTQLVGQIVSYQFFFWLFFLFSSPTQHKPIVPFLSCSEPQNRVTGKMVSMQRVQPSFFILLPVDPFSTSAPQED
jgi:hypothetical protein